MANTLPNLRHAAPVRSVFAAEHLAELARQALVAEAELTPKPGLVDRRGPGSHDDLSLDLMRRSASAIAPYFAAMAELRPEYRSQQVELYRDRIAALDTSEQIDPMNLRRGWNSRKAGELR